MLKKLGSSKRILPVASSSKRVVDDGATQQQPHSQPLPAAGPAAAAATPAKPESDTPESDWFGQPTEALWKACSRGQLETVKSLVDQVSKLDCHDPQDGRTPLHMAASRGAFDIVTLLLARGANLHEPDEEGSTALHYAAEGGRTDVVLYLLRKGAAVNGANKFGVTPLHLAAAAGRTPTVKTLIEKGANVNAVTVAQDSALHLISRSRFTEDKGGHLSVVRLLVEDLEADCNLRNKDGEFAHEVALKWGRDTIAAMLQANQDPCPLYYPIPVGQRRLALVITNYTYGGTTIEAAKLNGSLLCHVLKHRLGFEVFGNGPRSNLTAAQLESVIGELADLNFNTYMSCLVYYAGQASDAVTLTGVDGQSVSLVKLARALGMHRALTMLKKPKVFLVDSWSCPVYKKPALGMSIFQASTRVLPAAGEPDPIAAAKQAMHVEKDFLIVVTHAPGPVLGVAHTPKNPAPSRWTGHLIHVFKSRAAIDNLQSMLTAVQTALTPDGASGPTAEMQTTNTLVDSLRKPVLLQDSAADSKVDVQVEDSDADSDNGVTESKTRGSGLAPPALTKQPSAFARMTNFFGFGSKKPPAPAHPTKSAPALVSNSKAKPKGGLLSQLSFRFGRS